MPRPKPLTDVSVGEILEYAIGMEPGRWTQKDQNRVSAYLKKNGWKRYQRRIGQSRPWRYEKNPPSPE